MVDWLNFAKTLLIGTRRRNCENWERTGQGRKHREAREGILFDLAEVAASAVPFAENVGP